MEFRRGIIDTNLILQGFPMPKNRNDKYLKCDQAGVWHLNFRIPARFGGRLVRQSLFTNDFEVAASIRDRFVVPLLAVKSGIAALEEIGRSIIALEGEAINHLGSLKSIINDSEGMLLGEAFQRYQEWMEKTSDYRPATRRKYSENIAVVVNFFGPQKPVSILSKHDAVRLRDWLKSSGRSATTIFHVFSLFRGFLRWLKREGLIASPYVVENFQIDLPPVRKVNTPIIPPSKADEAMEAVPGWLIPRIQRYTGMRIGEVEACLTGYLGCNIVNVEGYRCFRITKEFCKTHADRYVPICEKLAPYMTRENIAAAKKTCAHFGADSQRRESPTQKRYNRAVKLIEGCETTKDHSWRVYAQTMMIEAGIDDLIVRRIIGHKDKNDVHYGYTAARVEAMKRALDTIP